MYRFVLGLKGVFRKKLRIALTILGISIGVMSVIIISIIGDVGTKTINSELDSMGISGIYLRAANESGDIKFSAEDLAIAQNTENVEQVTPLLTKIANIKVRKQASQAMVWGVDSNVDKVVAMEFLHGRRINRSDIKLSKKVCIVDESFALSAYRRSNIVGKTVAVAMTGGYVDFEVVGVVKSGGNLLQGLLGEYVPSFLYAPYSTLSNLTSAGGFNQLVVRIAQGVDEEATADTLVAKLNNSIGENAIKADNLNGQKDKLNGILSNVALILSVIGAISLVVAGLSIMTVMLVTVHERTREIGIKKAIGAGKGAILSEFLAEASIISLTGGIIGCVAAVAIGAAGCALLGLEPIINLQNIFICLLATLIMGTFFGVYPAIKAASLKPVEALRQE